MCASLTMRVSASASAVVPREVRVVAGRRHQRGREAGELGEVVLELRVQRQRAGHQTRGAGTGAAGLGGLHSGGDHTGVAGEAEVVVPRQVEKRLPTIGVAQRPGQPSASRWAAISASQSS